MKKRSKNLANSHLLCPDTTVDEFNPEGNHVFQTNNHEEPEILSHGRNRIEQRLVDQTYILKVFKGYPAK